MTEPSLADQLRRAPKYRHVCVDTLARIAAWSQERHDSPREALKAAKRKLHQIYGAYFDRMDFASMARAIEALPAAPDAAAIRRGSDSLLPMHASTRERLPFTEDAFTSIFAKTGPVHSVLDLACGLMPFAWPWLRPHQDTRYEGWDIDTRLVEQANAFFERANCVATVRCRDLLASPLTVEADLVLLLKTAPCLEQQEPGATLRVLRAVRARFAVLSFPTKSLGGREKGMARHYGQFADELAETLHASSESIEYPSETFYLLRME